MGLNANQTSANSLKRYFIVRLNESIILCILFKGFVHFNIQGQLRGRTEIAPDQREKFLQKFQQVQQQGPSTLLNMPSLVGGNHKQFSSQQQSPLLQQVLSCIANFGFSLLVILQCYFYLKFIMAKKVLKNGLLPRKRPRQKDIR